MIQTGVYFSHKALKTLHKLTAETQKFKPHYDDNTIHFNDVEMKVLHYFCYGLTNKEIGSEVKENERSVEGIKKRMTTKINVKHFIQVLLYCHHKCLIDLDNMPIHFCDYKKAIAT